MASKAMHTLSPTYSKERHQILVTELRHHCSLRDEAQLAVNAAVRELRKYERKVAELASELANVEQIRLPLGLSDDGKGVQNGPKH